MTTTIQLLDRVTVTTDFPERGIRRGDSGTVVEYLAPDVFEVEFSDEDGQTLAMFAVRADQLELWRPISESTLAAMEKRRDTFVGKLQQAGISYTLAHHRDEALMVMVTVPGERWEVEFFADGSVEVERFISEGNICGVEVLHELFDRYANDEDNQAAQPHDRKLMAVAT